MPIGPADLREAFESLRPAANKGAACARRNSIFSRIEFSELADEAKCELARLLITETCPRVGAFLGNGDAPRFLLKAADDMSTWPTGRGLASRRLEYVCFAMRQVAPPSSFASPAGALASVYLLHQIELWFRAISPYLNIDGTLLSEKAKAEAEQRLGRKPGKKLGPRVNSISDAYDLACLNRICSAVKAFAQLDADLPVCHTPGGKPLDTIGKRLKYLRDPASHGILADPSCDGIFYSLLTTIALYGSDIMERG